MRNIFNFLLNYNAFLTFFFLEIFCLYLVFQNNQYQKAGFINSSNQLVGQFYSWENDLTSYFNLKNENEKLAKENASLRAQLRTAYADVSDTNHIVNDTAHKQIYKYIPAKVVSITTGQINNYITINKGSADGITERMAVISPEGVVGKVKNVSAHFASITSVLNKDSKISARVNGILGSLVWKGDDPEYAYLEDVSKQQKIKVGDRVYTSGASLSYPEDITVGTVASLKPGSDINYVMKIKLSTNFYSLSYVYVVNYLMKDEQQKLEEKNQDAH